MIEKYDSAVARHYSAYRPPLHGPILSQVFSTDENYLVGVDIGCGTGHSSVALANYCDRVYGVDPSKSMLSVAVQHPKVAYTRAFGDDLSDVPARTVDVFTFAGSLHYTKTERLRKELNRLCRPGATLVVYDFEVLLDEVLTKLKVDIPAVGSDYDHAANILDWEEFSAEILDTSHLLLELSSKELGHVLLADSNRFAALSERYESESPFQPVVASLKGESNRRALKVKTYFARYRHS